MYSQGVQRMTAQPGLLLATTGALRVLGHVTGGIKAENIWDLVRHCGKVLGSRCLAGEFPPMLTTVQAGLGTAGCILP